MDGTRGPRLVPAIAFAVIALVAVGTIVGFAAGNWRGHTTTVTVAGGTTPAPTAAASVSPAVAAGAHAFTQFACSQCHGPQGEGGISPSVPALTSVGKTLTVAQLTHIINHGLGESANPKQPYMPVWGAVLSKTQVSNLVSYIRAGLPVVSENEPMADPAGPGPGRRRRRALRPLRLHQLPRAERPRRRPEPTFAR